ncbi:GGDEF domain-containing protein [Ralstonia mannitolilytica]|uniref:GGDEF domain-containing protein n=1 Tax=Ralstonia mannitolilytica TaxID=105219 RepID=UPI0013DE7352|nr:GGDEF domain-containing protein [Ralstonia mannitolilytica]QIF06308.1 diguanylate cyclase [Ralstonia mannitolilytica]
MSAEAVVRQPVLGIEQVTSLYSRCLLAGFALIPAVLITYLYYFQDPKLLFENHPFHEVAIAVATLEGGFVTYVCWRCYKASGEPLLRWLTLGFLGFSAIYAWHGAFTSMAHHNIWLFLLYGPASRLAMAIFLFIAQLSYDSSAESPDFRNNARMWAAWVTLFLAVDLAVGIVAHTPFASSVWLRASMEGGALAFSTLNVIALVVRRIRSPLMTIYGISVTSFALSSLAFLIAKPWNHLWWLAHAIFATGFFLLSYGVVRAFQTTHSFSTIYSQEELMARLAEAKVRTEEALHQLQAAHTKLEQLAATDPLTGIANRRELLNRIEAEIARSKRYGVSFSVLALDIDHFKVVNDTHGHQAGDKVLQHFTRKCLEAIRPYDGIARVGGEEFMVLLPDVPAQLAYSIGERIRQAVEVSPLDGGGGLAIPVTVSIGVSEFSRDGKDVDALLRVADERLYRAKHEGRNRVVAA